MKNLFLLATLLCGLGMTPRCQTTNTADSSHVMLQPDSNTTYVDETGKTMTRLQFVLAVKSGKYSFAPKVENGRIKSVQLVAPSEAVTMGKTAIDFSVTFLAITYDPAQRVKDFLAHQSFAFNIVADQQAMINGYGVTNFPTSLVIDKTGGVAFSLTAYDGSNVAQLDGVITALEKQK
jgi:hypothetical protein